MSAIVIQFPRSLSRRPPMTALQMQFEVVAELLCARYGRPIEKARAALTRAMKEARR